MAKLCTNPKFDTLLAESGLATPEAFLALRGVIYSGHPDRHVARVTLTQSAGEFCAYLKREHRVRWRDRLANAWCGFGLVSKSIREWRILNRLAACGIGCPEPIAAGESTDGRAFLLVREAADACSLREYLSEETSLCEREQLARQLGAALANIHSHGLAHSDLYAKHVLVNRSQESTSSPFLFLDWQRGFFGKLILWHVRVRDLATLCATLADHLWPDVLQRRFLEGYLEACPSDGRIHLPLFRNAWERIESEARVLLRRRKIREMRQANVPDGQQNLVWLDGEAVCVTQQFAEKAGGNLPKELVHPVHRSRPGVSSTPLMIAAEQPAVLSRRVQNSLLSRWWHAVRGKQVTSPELHQAATIFRLERFGVPVPRLLAVGQRYIAAGQMSSFLLTQPLAGAVPLVAWLREQPSEDQTDVSQRRRVILRAAGILRSIHAADCVLGQEAQLVIQLDDAASPVIGVASAAGMRPRRRITRAARRRDVHRLQREFAAVCSHEEVRRFILAYDAMTDRDNEKSGVAPLAAKQNRAFASPQAAATPFAGSLLQ